MRWILLALLLTTGASRTQVLAAAEPAGAGSAPAPQQILIEAVIFEVTLDAKGSGLDALKLPAQAVSRYPSARGAIDTPGMLLLARPSSSVPTNAAGSQAGGFHYLARLDNDLDATLKALAGDRRVKILQRPRIQTSHEVPASLFVGESRSYQSLSHWSGGGPAAVQEVLVGTTLDVIPSIQPNDLVTLDLRLKVDRFEGNQAVPNVGDMPVVSSREAQAKVEVRDRDTILLGGLVGAAQDSRAAYVPFPKELPVPSALASRSSALPARKELIVLLRPTLLASAK